MREGKSCLFKSQKPHYEAYRTPLNQNKSKLIKASRIIALHNKAWYFVGTSLGWGKETRLGVIVESPDFNHGVPI